MCRTQQDYLAESGPPLPSYVLRHVREFVEVLRREAALDKQDPVKGRPALPTTNRVPNLSLVVWILKREVRAIGGCLGIHRR